MNERRPNVGRLKERTTTGTRGVCACSIQHAAWCMRMLHAACDRTSSARSAARWGEPPLGLVRGAGGRQPPRPLGASGDREAGARRPAAAPAPLGRGSGGATPRTRPVVAMRRQDRPRPSAGLPGGGGQSPARRESHGPPGWAATTGAGVSAASEGAAGRLQGGGPTAGATKARGGAPQAGGPCLARRAPEGGLPPAGVACRREGNGCCGFRASSPENAGEPVVQTGRPTAASEVRNGRRRGQRPRSTPHRIKYPLSHLFPHGGVARGVR